MISRTLALWILLILWAAAVSLGNSAFSQPATQIDAEAAKQAAIAARYEQLLLRRPAPGTALDRYYAHHLSAGTLESVLQELRPEEDDDSPEAGRRWLLLGLLHLRQDDTANATTIIQQAEQLLPSNPTASYQLALLRGKQGDRKGAIDAMRRALARNPSRSEQVAMALLLGEWLYLEQHDDQAEAVWSDLRTSFSQDPSVLARIAKVMVDQDRLAAAIGQYQQLAGIVSPVEAIPLRLTTARLLERSGQADQAKQTLLELLPQVRPGSWLAEQIQDQLEAMLLADGGYQALADFYAVQMVDYPENLDWGKRLGHVQNRLQQYAAAEQTLRTILQRSPADTVVRETLIETLEHQNRWAEAAAQWAVLAAQPAAPADTFLKWGDALLKDHELPLKQRRDNAAKTWQLLADHRQSDALIQIQVADRLARIEKFQEAESRFRLAIQLDPKNSLFHEELGQFFDERNQPKKALEAWQGIATADNNSATALLRLAEIQDRFGYLDASLKTFLRAGQSEPLNLQQRLTIASRLLAAGENETVVEQLDAAQAEADSEVEIDRVWETRIAWAEAFDQLPIMIQTARETTDLSSAPPAEILRYATLLETAGRPFEAIEALETASQRPVEESPLLERLAQLYEQTEQLPLAIETLLRWQQLDPRIAPIALPRIADLHMRLQQTEEATAILKQVAEQQANNPNPWLELATHCFETDQSAAGYEALNRAVSAAPRSPAPLGQLANQFGRDFRTDEAIETYWKQWDLLEDEHAKLDTIAALSPLYDRRQQLPQLLEQLRVRFAEEVRANANLASQLATALEVAGDPGNALQTLLPEQIERPHDIPLLRWMVQLAERSGNLEQELSLTQALLESDPSPQTERQWTDLQVRAGRFPEILARASQLAGSQDDFQLQRLLRRLIENRHPETAAKVCQRALEVNPNVHTVRLYLALLRLDQDKPSPAEALAAIEPLLDDTPQSNVPIEQAVLQQAIVISAMPPLPHHEWGMFAAGLPDLDPPQTNFLSKVLATQIKVQQESSQQALSDLLGPLATTAGIESCLDLNLLWEAYFACRIYFQKYPSEPLSTRPEDHQLAFQIAFRLAQLADPSGEKFAMEVIRHRAAASGTDSRKADFSADHWPLSPPQLQWLESTMIDSEDVSTIITVSREYDIAGDPESADRLLTPLKRPSEVSQYAAAIDVHLAERTAQAILDQLPEWRSALRHINRSSLIEAGELYRINTKLANVLSRTEQASNEDRFQILATMLASEAAARRVRSDFPERWNQPLARVSLDGDNQTYAASPLLGRPLAAACIPLLNSVSPNVTVEINRLLTAPNPEVPEDEQKLRQALAAAQQNWIAKPDREESARLLADLAAQFPLDAELQIASGLQFERLQQHDQAIERLENAHPKHPVLLRLQAITALRLAGYTDDPVRGQKAGQALRQMALDPQTKRIITGQLKRLKLDPLADQFLSLTTSAADHHPLPLQRAQTFLKDGDLKAASEAAYDALRIADANERPQAAAILKQTERLSAVTEQLEKRLASNPYVPSLVEQLAILETTAGNLDRAAELKAQQQRLLRDRRINSGDAAIELESALKLSAQRNFTAALEHFLNGMALDASVLEPQFTAFVQAAQQAQQCDQVFHAITQCDLSTVSATGLKSLFDMDPQGIESPTKEGRKFQVAMLHRATVEQLGAVLLELRKKNRLAEDANKIAQPAVERFFAEQASFRPDAPVWKTGLPNADGHFFGSLNPIFESLQQRPELAEIAIKASKLALAEPSTKAIASGWLAILQPQDPNAVSTLRNAIENPQSALSGTWAWQLAQVTETIPDFPQDLTAAIYRTARDASNLNDQFRGTAGGVAASGFAFLKEHDISKARNWLLEEFQAVPQRQLTDEQRTSEGKAIALRFEQLGFPLDAWRTKERFAIPHTQTIEDRIAQDSEQTETIKYLDIAFSPDSPRAADKTIDPLLTLRPRIQQGPWQTSLATWTIDHLSKTEEGRKALLQLDQKWQNQSADEADLAKNSIRYLLAAAIRMAGPAPETATDSERHSLAAIEQAMQTDQPTLPTAMMAWSVANVAIQSPATRPAGIALLQQVSAAAEQASDNDLLSASLVLLIAHAQSEVRDSAALQLMEVVRNLPPEDLEKSSIGIQRMQTRLTLSAAARDAGETSIAIEAMLPLLAQLRNFQPDSLQNRLPETEAQAMRDSFAELAAILAATDPQKRQVLLDPIYNQIASSDPTISWTLMVIPTIGAETGGTSITPASLLGLLAEQDVPENLFQQWLAEIEVRRQTGALADIVKATLLIGSKSPNVAQAIDAMLESTGEELPALSEAIQRVEQRPAWTQSIQNQKNRQGRCQLADQLLIPLSMPAADSDTQQAIDRGLLRVAAMLASDQGIVNLARPQIEALLKKIRENSKDAALKLQAEQIQKFL